MIVKIERRELMLLTNGKKMVVYKVTCAKLRGPCQYAIYAMRAYTYATESNEGWFDSHIVERI